MVSPIASRLNWTKIKKPKTAYCISRQTMIYYPPPNEEKGLARRKKTHERNGVENGKHNATASPADCGNVV